MGITTGRPMKVLGCLGVVCAVGLFTPIAHSGPYSDARYMLYDGTDPEFYGVYAIGEPFLPPTVSIQPLKAAKDAVVAAVDTIRTGGFSDQVGAVAFSSILEWNEPLSSNFARVRARLRGSPLGIGGGLTVGLEAARLELVSNRARSVSEKMIVIVTDGQSDPTGALAQAQAAAAEGVRVHVVGVGANVDRALLDQIAAVGNGTVTYVDANTPSWIYGPELQAALQGVVTGQSGYALIQ